MNEETKLFIDAIRESQAAYGALGVLGAVSAGLYAFLRLFRLDLVQNLPFLPDWLRWNNWKSWTKMLVVFGLAFGAGLTATLATGGTWGIAIPSALIAGLTAMGIRSTEKAVVGTTPAGARVLEAARIEAERARTENSLRPPIQ